MLIPEVYRSSRMCHEKRVHTYFQYHRREHDLHRVALYAIFTLGRYGGRSTVYHCELTNSFPRAAFSALRTYALCPKPYNLPISTIVFALDLVPLVVNWVVSVLHVIEQDGPLRTFPSSGKPSFHVRDG